MLDCFVAIQGRALFVHQNEAFGRDGEERREEVVLELVEAASRIAAYVSVRGSVQGSQSHTHVETSRKSSGSNPNSAPSELLTTKSDGCRGSSWPSSCSSRDCERLSMAL